jgi:hypothetical protein
MWGRKIRGSRFAARAILFFYGRGGDVLDVKMSFRRKKIGRK